MFARISIVLCIVASIALLFAADLVIWHLLPQSFHFTGAFAFYFGAMLSVLAIMFAIMSVVKNGASKANMRVCVWSIAELLAFGFVYVYSIFSD